MVKLNVRFVALMLVVCLVLVAGVAVSQQPPLVRTAPTAESRSHQELAKAVLTEAGIAKRYDMYIRNTVEMMVSPGTATNTRFMNWMHGLIVQEAGWKYAEDNYIAQMTDLFSEAELQEVLSLVKQPIVKKLIQAEIEGYANAAGERRRLFFKVWDRYNSNDFSIPPGIFP